MDERAILSKAIQCSIYCDASQAEAILNGKTSIISLKPKWQHTANVVDKLLKNIIGPYSGISSAYAEGMLSKIESPQYNAEAELGWVYRNSRHHALSQWYHHDCLQSTNETLSIPVFVTVLSGDVVFAKGVKALWMSLRQCAVAIQQQFKFIVLCDDSIPSSTLEDIQSWHHSIQVIIKPSVPTPYEMPSNRRWESTFTKLRLFELCPQTFPKLIYMDSDMIAVTCDIFKLWQAPLFSAVAAGPESLKWKSINSGLMVFRPHPELFQYMLNLLFDQKNRSKHLNPSERINIGDQDIIQEAWETLCQWESNLVLHLPQRYNFLCLYANEYKLNIDYEKNFEPVVLHFIGPLKPWTFLQGKVAADFWKSQVPIYLHRYYAQWFNLID